ncbi:hypothetical protein P3X46_012446 [Hevea brasiliensis]|uniref:CCHC-type domain-containing protein n=1 Tax=Hevea brasiliensis TaxID=3981 RepID=A0ABQ9MCM8_HEVBR|nr:hypothetical protein P3X46_012446 [Hevea brasiliensis]
MRGSKQSTRFIGASLENEGMGALLSNPIIRERASKGGQEESLRSPKRSFEVSRETAQVPRMSINARRSSYESSRELKVVKFEQFKQTTNVSVNEYTNKFVELLQYVRQEYNIDKKKAKRYTQRLHSKYSLLILVAETHSFHSIVNAARKVENRIKSGLGMGGDSSSGSDTSDCARCGKCGQEGHISRECPNMERVAS